MPDLGGPSRSTRFFVFYIFHVFEQNKIIFSIFRILTTRQNQLIPSLWSQKIQKTIFCLKLVKYMFPMLQSKAPISRSLLS
jgi:hypothetical protein